MPQLCKNLIGLVCVAMISISASGIVPSIQANGATLWVIYWKNKTPTESGSWEIRGGTYREYVDHVCGEVN